MNDQEYWEAAGRGYDSRVFNVAANDHRGLIRRLVADARQPRGTAADLGCGVGHFLPLLAGSFERVVGLDFSASCLAECGRRHAGLGNLRLLRGDLVSSRRHFAAVDLVLSVNALLTPDPARQQKMLRSLWRHLKPGARLILVVPAMESALLVNHRLADWHVRCGESPAAAARIVAGADRRRELDIRPDGDVRIAGTATKHYLQEEILLRLRESGFDRLSAHKLEYDWDTEFNDPPRWLREPFPWDWCVTGNRA